MRKVFLAGAILCLTACATVTVQPAAMTTSLVSAETSLTRSSKDFSNWLEDEGWAPKNSAFSLIQSKLFTKSPAPEMAESYVDRLTTETPSNSQMHARMTADIQTIAVRLSSLNADARAYIATPANSVNRDDVLSFEDALVTARKAHKSILQACLVLERRDGFLAEDAKARLDLLDAEIKRSGVLADQLTDTWQAAGKALT